MVNLREEKLLFNMPLPLLIMNNEGVILDANEAIGNVFLYDGIKDANIFALTGFKASEIIKAIDDGDRLVVERNGKHFRLNPYRTEEESIIIIFYDITNFEDLKDRYNNEKPVSIRIEIDNYDELINPSGTNPRTELFTEIDKIIREWIENHDGTVIRFKKEGYLGWVDQENYEKLVEEKFPILDEIKNINIEEEAEFPPSLSIGIGVGAKSMAEAANFADQAIELAQGRGGDQVAIKKKTKTEFFGGQLQAVEKINRGKSRIIGHAMMQLIEQADRVFIMGHRRSDMDSFGSSLGIARFVASLKKPGYVVIDEVYDSLKGIYEEAKNITDYEIISSERALELVTEDSVLVVCDTHRPSMVQCPELLTATDKIVVIDHHRRLDDFIENATLTYMENFSASAAEMVSDILQFMVNKKEILKIEAEALLAGIMVDTNGFSLKAGVRTFEAASFLRRLGADPTEIKRFFQEDISIVKIKSDALAKTEMFLDHIAMTDINEKSDEAQVVCAMIADQLLTIKGVKASFVFGENLEGQTVISARSLGEINVQVIMEKMGGGGHLTVAGGQVKMSIKEAKCKIMEIIENK